MRLTLLCLRNTAGEWTPRSKRAQPTSRYVVGPTVLFGEDNYFACYTQQEENLPANSVTRLDIAAFCLCAGLNAPAVVLDFAATKAGF